MPLNKELWFINKTNLKTIVGQEGETIRIICSTDTGQYITALTLESNGSIKAIGDNQTVSYSFIPNRTDHLTKLKCVDSKHSSIMIEVELTISNGVPSINGNVLHTWSTHVKYEEIQPLSKNNRRYFVVLCSIAVVLFVYVVITHVWLCAKHVKTRFQRSHNVVDDHNYHTYDEIGTISYRAVSNLRSSDTIANHGLNLTEQHEVGISIAANLQSTDDNLAELNDDFREDDLEQHDVTEIQGENVSLSLGTMNISNTDVSRLPSPIILSMGNVRSYHQTNANTDSETQSDQQSQASNDPNSESSQNMVGNNDDEYENPYQTVLNDHRSNHQYVQITRERNNSISSSANLHLTDANTTELNANFLEDSLQQLDITGLQVQRMTMSVKDRDFSRTDSTSSTIIPSMQNIVNRNQTNESSTSDASDSDSSTNIIVGNIGDGYEHPYQTVLQNHPESHPYIEIIRERHSSISSTGSTEIEGQIVGTDSTKKEDYINLQF
ncbi:unnamed protein product [Mytilus edulis]|uniref:Uncharacterized protein n=1 Tax=Mytilus edulis TaxID=6550 RepID=A0A8S3RK12_MYTED|nr:unnamed protein product [Mytilus edulis]